MAEDPTEANKNKRANTIGTALLEYFKAENPGLLRGAWKKLTLKELNDDVLVPFVLWYKNPQTGRPYEPDTWRNKMHSILRYLKQEYDTSLPSNIKVTALPGLLCIFCPLQCLSLIQCAVWCLYSPFQHSWTVVVL